MEPVHGAWTRPQACSAAGCPEVRTFADGTAQVRSTSRPDVVTFTANEWRDLTRSIRRGEFNPAGEVS